MPPEKVYVVYAPYLPLSERVLVGTWELIPKADLRESDAIRRSSREVGLWLRGSL